MRNRTPKRAAFDRANSDWRKDLILEIGHCQLPDCPGAWPQHKCVHEIASGTAGRKLSFDKRLAVMVVCSHCNTERLTNHALWPPVKQAALQIILCAEFASPQEVIDVINSCRGRAKKAIEWKDAAKYLEMA